MTCPARNSACGGRRVFGVLESVLLLTVALGAAAAPALVSVLGTRGALVVAGLFLPALVVPSFGVLRRIDDLAAGPHPDLDVLRGVPFFASLPETALERLAAAAARVQVPADETVDEGEGGERFYVVAEGALGVTVDGAEVATLHAGDYFGEIALLRDVPRTATVRARRDSMLVALDRDDFLTAVNGYAPSSRRPRPSSGCGWRAPRPTRSPAGATRAARRQRRAQLPRCPGCR